MLIRLTPCIPGRKFSHGGFVKNLIEDVVVEKWEIETGAAARGRLKGITWDRVSEKQLKGV